MTFNLITEEVDEPNNEKRNDECRGNGTYQHQHFLRTHLAFKKRFINELTLISRCSLGDAVFLTLLKQQEIDARLYILLTSYLGQYAFLNRSIGDTSLVFAILRLDALTVDLGRTTCLQQGGLDARLQTFNGFRQRLYLW